MKILDSMCNELTRMKNSSSMLIEIYEQEMKNFLIHKYIMAKL